jgi:DNA-binding beta-propeller fold protein YncE
VFSRRRFLISAAATLPAALTSCARPSGNTRAAAVHVWGGQDRRDGCFIKPRAIGVHDNEIYVIDTTGRVQVFTLNGDFVRKWSMPESQNGTPTSITFAADGNVIIPDTHYSRIFKYTPDGKELERWGSYGTGQGQFVYPTDLALAPDGTYFFSEYGMDAERVHVFNKEKQFARQWGGFGEEPGKFNRAMGIDIDAAGLVYVADSANHRVQVFDQLGKLLKVVGSAGAGPNQIRFPYDLACAHDGTLLVCEYGNHRISLFRGESSVAFGGPGRNPGQFNSPRGVTVSPSGVVFVADTENHRIQRFKLEEVPA